MARIVYVNGRYVMGDLAAVSIEDRGYQFADGVYEVIWVQQGQPIDLERHLDRLHVSLESLSIPWPMSRPAQLTTTKGPALRSDIL